MKKSLIGTLLLGTPLFSLFITIEQPIHAFGAANIARTGFGLSALAGGGGGIYLCNKKSSDYAKKIKKILRLAKSLEKFRDIQDQRKLTKMELLHKENLKKQIKAIAHISNKKINIEEIEKQLTKKEKIWLYAQYGCIGLTVLGALLLIWEMLSHIPDPKKTPVEPEPTPKKPGGARAVNPTVTLTTPKTYCPVPNTSQQFNTQTPLFGNTIPDNPYPSPIIETDPKQKANRQDQTPGPKIDPETVRFVYHI